MGGDNMPQEAAAGPSSGADARAVPLDGDEFVVVEQEQENLQQADLPAKGPPPVSAADSAAIGVNLSTSTASSTTPSQQSSSCSTARGSSSGDDGPSGDADSAGLPRFDAAAAALIEAAGLLYKFFYAYAAVAFGFLHAHTAMAYEFVYAHTAMAYEFVYAYATVATQESLALLERAWSWARSVWQRVEEHSPASVKRAMRRGFVPAVAAVGLSLLLVLPAYWAIPRGGGGGGGGGAVGGAHRFSAQDWQAKHDLLSSKHGAETVRQRLKYDSLAGRHMELQQEYEALLKDFKNQQRAARAARNGPKTPPETCSKSDSVLGPVKDAFKVAEQTAYEYFGHFSEGLREDVREIAGRYFGKKSQEGGGGMGPGGSDNKRDGPIATVKALLQEEFKNGGKSKREEKAVNKMAEQLRRLSKEMESMKEWAPENFGPEEVDAAGVNAFKTKINKSKDKKPAVWGERGERESAKGDHEEEKTAESKASKARKKKSKKRDGKSKEKKSGTWGGWASDSGSESDEIKGKSDKPKAAKKVKLSGVEYNLFQDSLLGEDYTVKATKDKKDKEGKKKVKDNDIESPRFEDHLIPPDGVEKDKTDKKDKKDKEDKKSKKDKKDKKDKDVRSKEKEGKEKKVKGSQASVPVPAGVYGV